MKMASLSICGSRWRRLTVPLLVALAGLATPAIIFEVDVTTAGADGVAFVSSRILFFAAGDGIYRSTNGGKSWKRQYRANKKSHLRAVDFVDARHGWAVGNNGLILSTKDGGRHWVRRKSGTRRDLVDVDFIDRRHGWVVGQQTIVLGTTNGGKKWKRQLMPPQSRYEFGEAVCFFSRSVGLVAGFGYGGAASKSLYRTVNGGQRWSPKPSGAWGGFTDIDASGRFGCAVGYAQYETGSHAPICMTTDRGKTWRVCALPWPAALYRVDLVGSKAVFAVGADNEWTSDRSRLFRSRDAGATWQRVDLTVASALSVSGIHFTSGSRGVLVTSKRATYVTSNGGDSWRRR